MLIYIFEFLFYYTLLPVKSYKQLYLYKNGHFQLKYRFTSYILYSSGQGAWLILIHVYNL